jgi:hypothetical protein
MSTRDLWKRSLGRGAQWRYLVVFVVGMLVPTLLALLPIVSFLGSLFDKSPRAADLVSRLDSVGFSEVVKQLGQPDAEAIEPGLVAALIVAIVAAPWLAGAAAAVARANEAPSRIRDLLSGAGELYPRMLRMAAAACIPLGVAAGAAALAFHLASKSAERAVLESSADHAKELATAVSVLLVWLAHVTVEAGRAYLVAQPGRKSALLAWWSGVRLTVRHPLKVLGLCLMTTVVGVGVALLVTAVRYRIVVSGMVTIALGFVLAQIAVAAVAWGRSSRLVGLVALIENE